jgi:hypothetical protein
VRGILAEAPGVASVAPFADEGITDKPCGNVITLSTGARLYVQWVRTAAAGGEDQSQPEVPVTGQAPEPVGVPALPASGRTSMALVEEFLVAVITNGKSDEIKSVSGKTDRSGQQPYGLTIAMHSGANVYGLFLHTLPAGQSPGGEFQQREEV